MPHGKPTERRGSKRLASFQEKIKNNQFPLFPLQVYTFAYN